jgi:serine/threonine protein kinase
MTDPLAGLIEALRDRYRLDRELGRGGVATVFRAHDVRHDRWVALKLLNRDLGAAIGGERFRQAVRMAARLQHPHILTVHDSGEDGGQLWFTMPFIKGETLADRIMREGPLPMADALRIAREAADALDYAHREGVIHRDIKPENILLSEGHALVADFGIARALRGTDRGEAGSPAYLSPEQATGGVVDARADIYSLGAILYEMLLGEPPFTGATPQAVIARAITESPRPLARAPEERFTTAGALGQALEEAQSVVRSGPLHRPAPPTAGAWMEHANRGHRALVLALTVALLIVSALLLLR